MKYLLLTVTFIFLMSGSVKAEDRNTRWIMFLTTAFYGVDEPFGVIQQSGSEYENQTYQNKSDCYQGLKRNALFQNKGNPNFHGERRLKIEVINDVEIRAVSNDGQMLMQYHCIMVIID